jgi:hypothetical protein
MMMEKISNVKGAIERMFHACKDTEHLVCFKLHFQVTNLIGIYSNWGVQTGETWALFGKYVELFLPTANAISTLEGEKYITQSLILLQLCCLEKSAQKIGEKCMCLLLLLLFFSIPRSNFF